MLTTEEQSTRLSRAVEDLAGCVAPLKEELFLKAMNGWSVRDVVAHLIGWNRYVIEGSRQILRGELPFYDVDPGEDYSLVNAEHVRRYSATEKRELLAELRTSAEELGEFLRTLDPSAWQRDYGVTSQGDTVTVRSTVDDLIEDYAHHRGQIQEWQNVGRE